MQRFGSREEGEGVALVAHPGQNEIKRGYSSAFSLKYSRRAFSYSSAASSASGYSPLIRVTCSGFSGDFEIIASKAIRKLLSGWSGATWRSSPKNRCILSQGTCERSAGSFTRRL